MTIFQVDDMSCGHCAGRITAAVKLVDRDADVHVDLASKRVEISSALADVGLFQAAIEEAGYAPVVKVDAACPGASSVSKEG